MIRRKPIGFEKLDRLDDIIIDDILNMSDDEVIAEANEQFDDPKAEVARVRDILQKAVLQASKSKLAKAQADISNHKQRYISAKVVRLSNAQKKDIVDRFVGNDPELRQRLTLAARNGKGIQTESDIDSMFEDLIELGIINEQGITQ